MQRTASGELNGAKQSDRLFVKRTLLDVRPGHCEMFADFREGRKVAHDHIAFFRREIEVIVLPGGQVEALAEHDEDDGVHGLLHQHDHVLRAQLHETGNSTREFGNLVGVQREMLHHQVPDLLDAKAEM